MAKSTLTMPSPAMHERIGKWVGVRTMRNSASILGIKAATSRKFPSSLLFSGIKMVEGNDGNSDRDGWNSDDSSDDHFVDAEDGTRSIEGDEVLEPHVGMEFESENDATRFYNDYARRLGFTVRIMQRRSSETDGRRLVRRLCCNKPGFSPITKVKTGTERKPCPRAREGCKAAMLFKLEKSGKWVVTRFVKEHNHPLVVNTQDCMEPCAKDMKIQKLTAELLRQEELCAEYRERLIDILANIENQNEQFPSNVLAVVSSVRKAEAVALSIARA